MLSGVVSGPGRDDLSWLWNTPLPSPYLGSRQSPALLYELQDSIHVPLRGAEDLAKGDHTPVVVDS